MAFLALGLLADSALAQSRTYTLDADFDEGTLINVNHAPPNANQLQLNEAAGAFKFIWIAASARGTIVKIDTETGDILGEYRSAPAGQGQDPSRTTVDNDGNVWFTNRGEFGFVLQDAIAPGLPTTSRSMGSVTKVGLVENGQCEDRNGNGTIETSTGLSDIRPWPNGGGVDNLGGASTAEDECILRYTRVNSTGARHVSVTASNDVWVSGTGGSNFDLIDGDTGMIIRQESSVGFGGYGGLIDGNGVIWSANQLLRWDTANPLTGPNGDPAGNDVGPAAAGTNWSGNDDIGDSYGLCIDPVTGDVWNTQLFGNRIHKYAPDGTWLGGFTHGNDSAQGCAVDGNGHVWVAHSLFGGTTVGHLLSDGTYIGNVPLLGGNGPTGIAVDADGKVWSANINSNSASRIDPAAGPNGADGVTPVGTVDLTVDLGPGAGPYNYSDMTGSTLVAAPQNGTWTVVYNSGTAGAEWDIIDWTADIPGDAALTVTVASSADGVTFGSSEVVSNGGDVSVADGQYLRVSVAFARSTGGGSPVLYDLTVRTVQSGPLACRPDAPLSFTAFDADGLGDPRGEFAELTNGAADADVDLAGCDFVVFDPFTEDVTYAADAAAVVAPGGAHVWANAGGDAPLPVNTFADAPGGAFALVRGPAAVGDDVLDVLSSADVVAAVVYLGDGSTYGSVGGGGAEANAAAFAEALGRLGAAVAEEGGPAGALAVSVAPNPVRGRATVAFRLAEPGPVRVSVYDALGREVAVVTEGPRGAGAHEAALEATPLPAGVYVVRLVAGADVRSVPFTVAR